LIVDDRGVVCSRHEVLSNGCCAIEQKQTPKNEELSMTRKKNTAAKRAILKDAVLFMNIVFPAAYILTK